MSVCVCVCVYACEYMCEYVCVICNIRSSKSKCDPRLDCGHFRCRPNI